MSYHDDTNPIGVLIALVIGAGLIATGCIARTVGADFTIVFNSLLHSVIAFAIVFALCWLLGRSGTFIALPAIIFGFLTLVWPAWWDVLDSIANGDSDKSSLLGSIFSKKEVDSVFAGFPPPVEWYNDSLFKWGIEISLIGLAVFFIWKTLRD